MTRFRVNTGARGALKIERARARLFPGEPVAREWVSPDPPPSGDHITDAELDRLESLGPAGVAKARRLEAWRDFLDARLVEWRKLQREGWKYEPRRHMGRPKKTANHIPGHWRIVLAMVPGQEYRQRDLVALDVSGAREGSVRAWVQGVLKPRGVIEAARSEPVVWRRITLYRRRANFYRLSPLGLRMRRFLQRTAARIAAEIAEPGEGSSTLSTGKPPRKMRSGRRRRIKSPSR